MRACFAAAILLLAFPLAAADVITLGAEKAFDEFPHLIADASEIGQLMPNDGGWLLLFTRGSELHAMQLDRSGLTAAEWPLDTNVTSLQTIGVHAANGSYLASWREEGADHDVLAVISADGHTIVRTNPLPPQSSLVSLDCSADRCLGVTRSYAPPPADWWDYTYEIAAFSLLGETVAGPVSFGVPSLDASVVADGDAFKVAWSLWSDHPSPIHVLTVDRTAKIVSDEIVSQTGRFVTAARGTRPVFFFADGAFDVKAVASGEAPKTVAHLTDGPFVEDVRAAWNGNEFLLVINAEPPGSWVVFECVPYPEQVYGIRVNAALDPIDAAAFPLMHVPIETTFAYPTVAASGGEFLAGGSRYGCGTTGMPYLTHVTPSGTVDPPDLGRPVVSQGSSAAVVSAASVAGTDAAVWYEPGDVRTLFLASRLGRDSQPIVLSSVIQLGNTSVHSASDGHSLFVIDDACTAVDILDGTAGTVSHRPIGCGARILALAWSGSHYVAAVRTSDSVGIIRFGADGTLLGMTILMKAIPDDAEVAPVGGSSVVVWTTGGTMYAAAVSDSGSLLAAPHAIAAASLSMALASDGTSVLLIQKASPLVIGYLLSSDSMIIDQAVLDTSADSGVFVAAGRADGRWIAIWSSFTNTIHAFATLHSGIATATLPAPSLLLTRPDGSAAAVMAVWREKDGMRGQVVVEREIEITARQRRRAAGAP